MCNREELPDHWKESYYCTNSQKRVIKLTVVIIVGYPCYQLHTTFQPVSFCQG
jgi:hypothetical protein